MPEYRVTRPGLYLDDNCEPYPDKPDPKPNRSELYAEYGRLHAVCPECGGKGLTSTLMGFGLMAQSVEEMEDPNHVDCMCGWSGRGHDLVPEGQK
jgi:hypothetical protein